MFQKISFFHIGKKNEEKNALHGGVVPQGGCMGGVVPQGGLQGGVGRGKKKFPKKSF